MIYVARNPKDVLVSYFHFHNIANMLETPKDFADFFEKFLRGDGEFSDRNPVCTECGVVFSQLVMNALCVYIAVFGCSWFEHIKTWCSQKDDMNMLFITYEEMIQVRVQIIFTCSWP